jgi:hypothetical protein
MYKKNNIFSFCDDILNIQLNNTQKVFLKFLYYKEFHKLFNGAEYLYYKLNINEDENYKYLGFNMKRMQGSSFLMVVMMVYEIWLSLNTDEKSIVFCDFHFLQNEIKIEYLLSLIQSLDKNIKKINSHSYYLNGNKIHFVNQQNFHLNDEINQIYFDDWNSYALNNQNDILNYLDENDMINKIIFCGKDELGNLNAHPKTLYIS